MPPPRHGFSNPISQQNLEDLARNILALQKLHPIILTLTQGFANPISQQNLEDLARNILALQKPNPMDNIKLFGSIFENVLSMPLLNLKDDGDLSRKICILYSTALRSFKVNKNYEELHEFGLQLCCKRLELTEQSYAPFYGPH